MWKHRQNNCSIRGNELFLSRTPSEDKIEGLTIVYVDWFLESKRAVLPIIHATIKENQTTYDLPDFLKGLNKWRILQIDANFA